MAICEFRDGIHPPCTKETTYADSCTDHDPCFGQEVLLKHDKGCIYLTGDGTQCNCSARVRFYGLNLHHDE